MPHRAAKSSRPDAAVPSERAVHAQPYRNKEPPYSGRTDRKSRTAGRPQAAVIDHLSFAPPPDQQKCPDKQ
jgi:hypothetical protein